MADYFTQFSCMFDVGSAENATAALVLLDRLRDEPDDNEPPYGFDAVIDPSTPTALWISDGDGHGDPEHVIAFVLACAEAFDLTGRWGFVWALTCSRPRLDGFGGGAQLLDLGARKSLAWLDCDHWLQGALDPTFAIDISDARTIEAPEGVETKPEDASAFKSSLPVDDEPIEDEFGANSPRAIAAE